MNQLLPYFFRQVDFAYRYGEGLAEAARSSHFSGLGSRPASPADSARSKAEIRLFAAQAFSQCAVEKMYFVYVTIRAYEIPLSILDHNSGHL
jgi:hypothetical protein